MRKKRLCFLYEYYTESRDFRNMQMPRRFLKFALLFQMDVGKMLYFR